MEIPTLGENCAFRGCGQLDFLPFVCKGCARTFCLDHRNDHGCGHVAQVRTCIGCHHEPLPPRSDFDAGAIWYAQDTTCVVCPLCGSSVKHVPGESIHVTFERHSSTSCDPNKHPSRSKRCGAPRCKEKLTAVNAYRCRHCGTEVCMTHRFPDKHACEERKRANGRTSTSSPFAAAASGSIAARASAASARIRDAAATSARAPAERRAATAAREVCDVCGKSFPHIAALIAHAESAHRVHGAATRARVTGSGNLGVETCPRCGERFADVAALVDHVERVHERGGGAGTRRTSSSSQCTVS